ncbi:hypothetical protein [Nocardia wallacei]|uniref:hypothetical protein n=1 Tax=Nocardia wallacei TaxID=480035 RepID=UPI0024539C0D|nr:hypothetical protein [Nocardia wallacei]
MRKKDRVYRLVIDSYPTPDGLPFTEQPAKVWGLVGQPGAPEWMPGPEVMKPWERVEDGSFWTYFVPPDFHRHQRFLNPGTARFWLNRALALGCTAHVETALVGPYKPIRRRRRAEGGDTTTPESAPSATEQENPIE